VAGVCLDPTDCRTNGIGCSGLTYCEPSTGVCLPGCDVDAQCPGANDGCDTDINDCVCDAGFDRCGTECVDLDSNPLFCGRCDNACGTGWDCQGGVCYDPTDCRTNGIDCSDFGFFYCHPSTGDCTSGCDSDAQCPGANDGCDTDINDCVCDAGFERCPPIAGACVDTQTDPLFCGDCGTACGTGEVCQAGACYDPSDCRIDGIDCSGLTYCDPSTGACVRCLNDAQCGATNEVCDTDINDCVCDAGFDRCGTECVDLDSNPLFCGDCGTACETGWDCEGGVCVPVPVPVPVPD
jgi:hypothetical protein